MYQDKSEASKVGATKRKIKRTEDNLSVVREKKQWFNNL